MHEHPWQHLSTRMLALVFSTSLILLYSPAALGIDTAIEHWSRIEAGMNVGDPGDWNGSIWGIAIDEDGFVVSCGVDLSTEEDAAFEVTYDLSGEIRGMIDSNSAGADVWRAVAVDADSNFAIGGMRWDEATVAKYDGLPGSLLWHFAYDSIDAEPHRANSIAFFDDGSAIAAGVEDGSGEDTAQWFIVGIDNPTGDTSFGPIHHNVGLTADLPDEAFGVVVDGQGDFVVVGQVGVSGTSPTENTDWHVRKYHLGEDLSTSLLWEHTFDGTNSLIDRAWAVAVDSNDDIIVVGESNEGTDNVDNADFDWVIIKYASDGSEGLGQILWIRRFESDLASLPGEGRNESAFGVAVDEDDNVIVVGYELGETGVRNARVERRSGVDGSVLSARVWETDNDSAFRAVATEGSRIAMGGYQNNAFDDDFWTVLLEYDADGDGVADSADGCPDTPADEEVNGNGCSESQADDDGDGVSNVDDQCPDTPSDETPDVLGCSWSQHDADGDGVPDAVDLCPNTPAGEVVNVSGCSASQLDDDGDGVSNAADLCPGTTAGEVVNATGCSDTQIAGDTDEDGIPDADDLCPGTPSGETVDEDGCSDSQLDDDNDGVSNADDLCPETPAEEVVDEDGCAESQSADDDDGDGIPNENDLCPETPTDEVVNTDGCSDSQLDDDNDGVSNAEDRCEDTPAGEEVDHRGCAESQLADDDGDGVLNANDRCPGTPANTTVNSAGCPVTTGTGGDTGSGCDGGSGSAGCCENMISACVGCNETSQNCQDGGGGGGGQQCRTRSPSGSNVFGLLALVGLAAFVVSRRRLR